MIEVFLTSDGGCSIHEDTVLGLGNIRPTSDQHDGDGWHMVSGCAEFISWEGVVVGCHDSFMRRMVSNPRNILALGGR